MSSFLPFPPTHPIGRVLALDVLLSLVTAESGDPRTALLASEYENYVRALRDSIQAIARGLTAEQLTELERLRRLFGAFIGEGPPNQRGVIPWELVSPFDWVARWNGLRLRAIQAVIADRDGWAWAVHRVLGFDMTTREERLELIGEGYARDDILAKKLAAALAITATGSR